MRRATQCPYAKARARQNGAVDIAVNLVESYLRLNGYLTLSELDVQRKNEAGTYESVTDVDIVALRFPGDIYAVDAHGRDCELLLIHDEALRLEDDTIDVVVGEVKEGEAEFNLSITRHEVLHSVLQRVEWVYGRPIDEVVDSLHDTRVSEVPACNGLGRVRTRLVAFGQSAHTDLHTISLAHVFEVLVGHLEELGEVLRPVQFKDPALGLMKLLVKTGFSVARDGAS